jgi:hypothetical protein
MPRQKGVKFVEETVISTHFMRMLKMTLIQITQRETELCYKLGATVTWEENLSYTDCLRLGKTGKSVLHVQQELKYEIISVLEN